MTLITFLNSCQSRKTTIDGEDVLIWNSVLVFRHNCVIFYSDKWFLKIKIKILINYRHIFFKWPWRLLSVMKKRTDDNCQLIKYFVQLLQTRHDTQAMLLVFVIARESSPRAFIGYNDGSYDRSFRVIIVGFFGILRNVLKLSSHTIPTRR